MFWCPSDKLITYILISVYWRNGQLKKCHLKCWCPVSDHEGIRFMELNGNRHEAVCYYYKLSVLLLLGQFCVLINFNSVSLRWCTEVNEATQTRCYNPVAPAYPIWAYYAHGRQHWCQEDPVSFPSGRLEKTTRSSPHHMAQHRPTGSETSPTLRSQKQQIWLRTALCGGWCRRMALRNSDLHARNDDDDEKSILQSYKSKA